MWKDASLTLPPLAQGREDTDEAMAVFAVGNERSTVLHLLSQPPESAPGCSKRPLA